MTARSPITTHVLDTALGRPAKGIAVRLERRIDGGEDWVALAKGTTDADGRAAELLSSAVIERGVYRIVFETAPYFEETGRESFYPYVSVVFRIERANEHYHVPLLLNPFGYSTYRGS